jgi:hypothetical protein
MNGFVTTQRYARVLDLPLSFVQTELRSGKMITVAVIPLALHQRLVVRTLTVMLVNILTPGAIPEYLNTSMRLCSAGLYRGTMVTSPLVYAAFSEANAISNPFSPCVIETPGNYTLTVSNNTSNLDLAVVVTGSAKLYY